jgi:hypothetical protein
MAMRPFDRQHDERDEQEESDNDSSDIDPIRDLGSRLKAWKYVRVQQQQIA